METLYKNAHMAIRRDPVFKPSDKSIDWKSECKKHKLVKLTLAQRRANIQGRIQKFNAAAGEAAAGEASEDDDE